MENGGAYSEEPAVNHREPEHDLCSEGVITFVEHDLLVYVEDEETAADR